MNSTAQLARDPQAHLPTGPTHVAYIEALGHGRLRRRVEPDATDGRGSQQPTCPRVSG